MARKHRPPSRERYAAAHPTIGVHVDVPTYNRLVKLRDESGFSFGYLVRRALGVVEKEVGRAITRGFNKGRHAGYAEGRKAGLADGRRAGFEEGKKSGYEEGHAAGYDEGWRAGNAEPVYVLKRTLPT